MVQTFTTTFSPRVHNGAVATASSVPPELLEALCNHHSDEAAILDYGNGEYQVAAVFWHKDPKSGAMVYEDLHHHRVRPVLFRRDLV
ncbi:MAG: hypothetical protein ACP5PJ_09740, partial [Acidimicrobiales bacterium]